MLRRRLLTATALAAAAAATAAALPSAASADGTYRETDYRADIEVRGSWSYHRKEAYGDRRTDEVSASVDFVARTSVEYVLFRNGQMVTPDRWGPTTVTDTGGATRTVTYPRTDGSGGITTVVTTCDTYAGAGLPAEIQPAPSMAGHAGLAVRLMRGGVVGMSGGCDERVGGSGAIDNPYAPLGGDVFDKTIQLPQETIGFGEITEFLEAGTTQRSPSVCPGRDAFTDQCEFTWTATVKFVRTGGDHYDPAQQPDRPLPPPPPPPIDPRADAIAKAVEQYGKEPAVDPRADAISKAVEQYGRDVPMDPRAQIISDAVDQYGRELELELGCTAGCSGTAVVTPGAAAGGAAQPRAVMAAKAKPVARIAFKVAAGKPRKVRLRLPAKARKALARSRGARVRITLKPRRGGPTATRTLAVRRKR